MRGAITPPQYTSMAWCWIKKSTGTILTLPSFCMSVKLGLSLWRKKVYENEVKKRIFGHKERVITLECRELHNEELQHNTEKTRTFQMLDTICDLLLRSRLLR